MEATFTCTNAAELIKLASKNCDGYNDLYVEEFGHRSVNTVEFCGYGYGSSSSSSSSSQKEEKWDFHTYPGMVRCYVGQPSTDALVKVLDDLWNHIHLINDNDNGNENDHDEGSALPSSFTFMNDLISFQCFDFHELPSSIMMGSATSTSTSSTCRMGRMFPHVQICQYEHCPNLSSLGTTVTQFPNLQELECIDCPSLHSLSSLSAIPLHLPLQRLSFVQCGLEVVETMTTMTMTTSTVDDDWEGGFRAIGRCRQGQGQGQERRNFSIEFILCDKLTRLPSSIQYLEDNEEKEDQYGSGSGGGGGHGKTSLYLEGNAQLKRLPFELGELRHMKLLVIQDCPSMMYLPWTMGRINGDCIIRLDGSIRAVSEWMNHDRYAYDDDDDYAYAIGTTATIIDQPLSSLEPYFEISRKKFYHGLFQLCILFHQARIRAVDRLFRPGGAGFEQSRINFETMREEEEREYRPSHG